MTTVKQKLKHGKIGVLNGNGELLFEIPRSLGGKNRPKTIERILAAKGITERYFPAYNRDSGIAGYRCVWVPSDLWDAIVHQGKKLPLTELMGEKR